MVWHLPEALVYDRPGRQQEDGRVARAVLLVVEPHAVVHGVSAAVWLSRLHERLRCNPLDERSPDASGGETVRSRASPSPCPAALLRGVELPLGMDVLVDP